MEKKKREKGLDKYSKTGMCMPSNILSVLKEI